MGLKRAYFNRLYLERAVFETFKVRFIFMSFESTCKVMEILGNFTKYLNGFGRYDHLNSEVLAFSNLYIEKEKIIQTNKLTNTMTHSHRHTIQAHACQIS